MAEKTVQSVDTYVVALTTGHSNYTGANAVDGQAAGAGGDRVTVSMIATGNTTIGNSLRVYFNASGTKTYWRSFPIPVVVPDGTKGIEPMQMHKFFSVKLKSGYKLSYDEEKSDAINVIEEHELFG